LVDKEELGFLELTVLGVSGEVLFFVRFPDFVIEVKVVAAATMVIEATDCVFVDINEYKRTAVIRVIKTLEI
jgi:hypothetical protein